MKTSFKNVSIAVVLIAASFVIQARYGFLRSYIGKKDTSPLFKGVVVSGKVYPHSMIVDITSDTNPPVGANQPFTLTLYLSSQNDVANVEVEWIVPSGVKILSGAASQQVALKAGVPMKIPLTLSLTDSKNRVIIARASYGFKTAKGEETRRGGIAHFITNPSTMDSVHHTVLFQDPSQKSDNRISQ